jgi:hypothetical protein
VSLTAAVGQSQAMGGREAGAEAAKQALEKVGLAPVVFAWVIVSRAFGMQEAVSGVVEVLGNAPLLGFSTSAELTGGGRSRRSVVVAVCAGADIQSRAGWWPDYAQDSRAIGQAMLRGLRPDGESGEILLLAADGVNGDAEELCRTLLDGGYSLAGCLAGGELWRGRTFQVGGRTSGSGGLAGAVLSGNIVAGLGAAHGWLPVGALARLTRVQGQWVRMLDGVPVSETYSRLFGYPARSWSYPPLNEMVRQYPLGLPEAKSGSAGAGALRVRAPLRMEADGSLRMNSLLPEGEMVELLIGSPEACRQAAQQAAAQAREALGHTQPRLALVLVDVAWQALFDLDENAEIAALRQALGPDVPIAGGYTFGQIARLESQGPAQFLNQHMLVILFGDKTVELGGVAA